MKFDPTTNTLYSDDQRLLKKLDCPLKKNWSALVIDKETPLKRYCNSCTKYVIDITDFNDQQVIDLLKIDADSCLCIREDSPHIKWVIKYPGRLRSSFDVCVSGEEGRYEECRIVKTARTAKQIESNQDNYIVIEKAVEINNDIKEKVVLKYNRAGYSGFDLRAPPEGITNWWHPLKSTSPFAAYLVPKDTEVGEKVFVPDIIEDFVAVRWNQGDVYRRTQGFGIFAGDDIEFEYSSNPSDAPEFVG